VTSSLEQAVHGTDMWVFATPTQAMRSVAERVAALARDSLTVVSVSKGIEIGSLKTTSEVLDEVLAQVSCDSIGVLYGPSHAEEVAIGIPTAVVASSSSVQTATNIQSAFMAPTLRVYVNKDLRGVEVAGSVKNVMAIAAGISEGVGYGDNTKAALLTRGMAEMTRLGLAMGASPHTFAGLAGIGDLVVTCMSRHSRNRYVGEQIGKGLSLEEIEREMRMVAEGVSTTRSVVALADKYDVEMPITESVYSILFEGKRPEEAVYDLMTRTAKHEDHSADVWVETFGTGVGEQSVDGETRDDPGGSEAAG
jgi:glycerol-3-phosphate dehydrogenase (NAD(P)+)